MEMLGKTIIALVLLIVTSVAATAQFLPISIDEVQVEDVTLEESFFDVNRLDLERGQEIEVEIHISAFEDLDNIEVTAFLSGYEYNDVDPISDQTHVFRVEENVKYIKKLNLKLPDLAEVDRYKLRILVSDRDNFETIQSYDILLDTKRHDLKISDIILYPDQEVKSGTALLTRVRVENYGQKDENDVKVRVTIPDLGLSAVDYINEVESDEEEETEEMYLKLPCAKAGEYAVKIDVSYDEGHRSLSASRTIKVSEGDLCKQLAAPTATTTQVVTQPAQPTVNLTVPTVPAPQKSVLRTALEVILLVLVGLLVIVGLVIGFSRMKENSE